jgi:hypothetical protein
MNDRFVYALVALSIVAAPSANCQTVGTIYENSISVFDKRNAKEYYRIPLPPGKWEAMQVRDRSSSGNAAFPMRDIKLANIENGFLASVIEITAKTDDQFSRWNDEPCKIQQPLLHKNDYSTRLWRQKCLTIVPSVVFQNTNEATQSLLALLSARGVKNDFNGIASTFTKFDDIRKYLVVRLWHFPSLHGLENPVISVINTSPFHPSNIDAEPKRAEFRTALISYMEQLSQAFDDAYEGKPLRPVGNFAWRAKIDPTSALPVASVSVEVTRQIELQSRSAEPRDQRTPISESTRQTVSSQVISIQQNSQQLALAPRSSQGATSQTVNDSSIGVMNETSINLRLEEMIVGRVRDPIAARAELNSIQSNIVLFITIREQIAKRPLSAREKVLASVDKEISRLKSLMDSLQESFSKKYSTPIYPENRNLGTTAFRASSVFPRIPYYIAGTKEFGEIHIAPEVSRGGELQFNLVILDPAMAANGTRETISVQDKYVGDLIAGLDKISEWTLVAQQNEIRRNISKSSACFPTEMCEQKVQGNSSIETVFQLYDDGSTAAKLQINKGRFAASYNFSVESSILLSAYLQYMQTIGKREFSIGTLSDTEIKNLFK